VYDFYFNSIRLKELIRGFVSRYLGYIVISIFHLYIYFKIFPNTTLGEVGYMGGSLLSHVTSALWIFSRYIYDLCLPMAVNIIPPLYAPNIHSGLILKAILSLSLLVVFIYLIIVFYKKSRRVSFFLLWFVISLLPVLNIIPIANPIAHRFLYLPSIGLLTVFAIGIENLCHQLNKNNQNKRVEDILKLGIMIICISVTFPLNTVWRNNFSVGAALISNYPKHAKSFTIVGMEFFKVGNYKLAALALGKSLELGSEDPRIHYLLGMCLMDQPKRAEYHFIKSINLFPAAVNPYIGLGRMYFLQKNYENAIKVLKQSTKVTPTYSGYGYLIQAYIKIGNLAQAQEIFYEAKKHLFRKDQMNSLKKLLQESQNKQTPIDIGI